MSDWIIYSACGFALYFLCARAVFGRILLCVCVCFVITSAASADISNRSDHYAPDAYWTWVSGSLINPNGSMLGSTKSASSDLVEFDGYLITTIGVYNGNVMSTVSAVLIQTQTQRWMEVYVDGVYLGKIWGKTGTTADVQFSYVEPQIDMSVPGVYSSILGYLGQIQVYSVGGFVNTPSTQPTTNPTTAPTTQGGEPIVEHLISSIIDQTDTSKVDSYPVKFWGTFDPAFTWQQASMDFKSLTDSVIPGSLAVSGASAESWARFGLDGPNELIASSFQAYGQVMTDYASLFVFTRAFGNFIAAIGCFLTLWRIVQWGLKWNISPEADPPIPMANLAPSSSNAAQDWGT